MLELVKRNTNMETKPKLELVPPLELAKVIPIRRALGYLSTMQSLPDNVYLLPKTPSLEPDIA